MTSPSKKEESFFDKITTIGRKKKTKEAQDLQGEERVAFYSDVKQSFHTLDQILADMEEGEERTMVDNDSRRDPKVMELIQVLLDWTNDELASERIIVKDIEEDFYDGQVFQKLIEHLSTTRISAPEVSQSEIGQKQKLKAVLQSANEILHSPKGWNQQQWTIDLIHSKNMIAILRLLIALAVHYQAAIRLPDNVFVKVIIITKQANEAKTRTLIEEISTNSDLMGGKPERDAFDTLFDHAPDKLSVVKKTLIGFVNKHLNKINLEVSDIEHQFHDGVNLILLMGLLGGYFVPLYYYHHSSASRDQMIHNVSLSFELMEDAGLPKPTTRPEDVVDKDLKSTLRVLYNLFTKYKGV